MKYLKRMFDYIYNIFHKEDKPIQKPKPVVEIPQPIVDPVKVEEKKVKAQKKSVNVILTAYRIARSYLGTKEIRGKKHNKVVQSFYERAVGHIYGDETPWCAAFVNSCLVEAGIKGTGKLNARSFLKWGVNSDYPKEGDIVVFWRGSKSSWKGHVGFYVGDSGRNIKVLGGNQSNKVCIQNYPKKRILGYRKSE